LTKSIERLQLLKKYIEQIVENISPNFWVNLNLFHKLILPFNKAVNNIQTNNATLYYVWMNFNEIINFFSGEKDLKQIVNMDSICDIIVKKWKKHINNELIEATRLFNLDANFKYTKDSIEFIKKWGSEYLFLYNYVDNNTKKEDLIEIIGRQLNEFISRYGDFSSINSKNENLKLAYSKNRKSYDIKLLWNLFYTSHYELTMVANAILSICPSNASVERSFSIQQDVHTLERNKLSCELINAEMSIKMNLKS
jgi:hypothetical protein